MPLPHSDQRGTVPAPRLTMVARVLVYACPGLIRPLLAQTGPRPGCLCPHQTPQPSRGRPSPIPMPLARNFLSRPNLTVQGGPLHTQPGIHSATQDLWHKVQRWTTNCFSATPTGILTVESCLPPIPLLISQRQRLAALIVACSPPQVNQATARLHPSFHSLSSRRAHDSSRALTSGHTSVYLPLHLITPGPSPHTGNHLPIEAVAHRTIPFTHGLSRMPMIKSHLVTLTPAVPPWSSMDNTYGALKKRVRETLLKQWPRLFLTSGYYHHPPALNPRPFMGLNKFIAGRIHQISGG